jgi:hypothetical protein
MIDARTLVLWLNSKISLTLLRSCRTAANLQILASHILFLKTDAINLHLCAGGGREPARRRGEQPGVRSEPSAPGPRLRLHGCHPHAAAAGAGAGGRARRRQGRDRQAQVPPRGHRTALVARLPAPRRLGWPRASSCQVCGEDGDVSGIVVLVIDGVRRRVELHRL